MTAFRADDRCLYLVEEWPQSRFGLLKAERPFTAPSSNPNSFTSLATTLRTLQGDNDRIRRVRADFLGDFDVDIYEFDDADFKDQEFEVNSGY